MKKRYLFLLVVVLVLVAVIATIILINYQRERNRTTAIINLLQQYQTSKTPQEERETVTDAVISYRQNLPIEISLSFSQAEERQSKEWCDNLWIVIQNVAANIVWDFEGGDLSYDTSSQVYVDSMDALLKFWLDNGCFYYD